MAVYVYLQSLLECLLVFNQIYTSDGQIRANRFHFEGQYIDKTSEMSISAYDTPKFCAMHCLQLDACLSFAFVTKASDNRCHLSLQTSEFSELEKDGNSRYYTKVKDEKPVCPFPPDIKDGNVTSDPGVYNYQAQVTYRCDNTFHFADGLTERTLTCNDLGQWDTIDVNCYINYDSLLQMQFTQDTSVASDTKINNMRLEGEELWVTTAKTLKVYTQTLTLIRPISLENLTEALSVVRMETGQLLVNDWTHGIKIHNADGTYHQYVKQGDFHYVFLYENQIWALPKGESNVSIYTSQADTWQQTGTIQMNHMAETHDSLLVSGDGYVYIASVSVPSGSKIYQLSHNGTMLDDKFGPEVDSQLQNTYTPHLSSVDALGNVVIADMQNKKGIVCKPGAPHGDCRDLNVVIKKSVIGDILVHPRGQYLWTYEADDLQFNNVEIVKYKAN